MMAFEKFCTPIFFASAVILLSACASNSEMRPTGNFEAMTAKSPAYKCQSGYVLTCETKNVGRIRFNRIGQDNIEYCACEVEGNVPVQSPLPGIY